MATKNFKVNNGLTTPLTTFEYTDGNVANTRQVILQPSASSANYTLTLPTTAGSNGQFVSVNGSGNLSFSSPTILTSTSPVFGGDLLFAASAGDDVINVEVGSGSNVANVFLVGQQVRFVTSANATSYQITLVGFNPGNVRQGYFQMTPNLAASLSSGADVYTLNSNAISTIQVGSNISLTVTGTTATIDTNITSLASGNSNVRLTANGNVTISANGNSNIFTVTSSGNGNLQTTGVNVAGYVNSTANISAANFVGALANGNSNVNIAAANGNVTIGVAGNSAIVTATGSNVVLGNGVGLILSSNNGSATRQVQLKTSTDANFSANYALTLPVNDGDSGQFIQTDGSGVLSFGSVSTLGTANTANIVTVDDERVDYSVSSQALPSSTTWSSVAYGNSVYVAIATGGTSAATSPDGETWTSRTLPNSASWSSMAYGNGTFVAISGFPTSNSDIAATSTDGINWTSRTLPVSDTWRTIAYGNGSFVAIAAAASPLFDDVVAYSTDNGATWTESAILNNGYYSSIAYGNGAFVVVQAGVAGSENAARSTDNGVNWSFVTLPATANWQSVAYGSGVFVAVASGGTSAASSSDGGATWTARTLPASASWNAVAYGDGAFVATSTGSSIAATSYDGITWTQVALPTSSPWSALTYGTNGQFVAVAGTTNSTAVALIDAAYDAGGTIINGGLEVTGNITGNITFSGNITSNVVEAAANANLDLMSSGTGNININAGSGNVVITSSITSTGNFFVSNIFVGSTLSANSLPGNYVSVNNRLTLGASSTISGNLIPNANSTFNVGNSDAYWNTGYFAEVRTPLANITRLTISGNVTGNLLPGANITYDLGNSTQQWNNVAAGNVITGTVLNGNSNITILSNSSILMSVAGNSDILAVTGTGANITGILNVSNVANVGNLKVNGNVQSNLLPNANITYDLGSSTQRWKDIWLANSTIYLGSQNISANTTTVSFSGNLSTTGSVQIAGKQATNGPAFRAYVSTGQTITSSGSQQKVTFGGETFDTDADFATSRFTPGVEGYYQLNSTVRISGGSGTGECMLVLYKNGTEYSRGTNEQGNEQGTNFYSMQVSDIAYANGTTDYFEIYIQQTSGADKETTAGENISYFSGVMVRGA